MADASLNTFLSSKTGVEHFSDALKLEAWTNRISIYRTD